MLYNATFWTDGTLKNNQSFEFDSRCPESDYIPAIQQEIGKLDKSLLQKADCTWAYLGFKRNTEAEQKNSCYLLWTSLNTNKVGGGKQIPVLIQTSAGKYYVSETTTDQRWRNGKKYVTVSKRMDDYKDLLSSDREYPTLEEAYDAYIVALNDEKYGEVRESSRTPQSQVLGMCHREKLHQIGSLQAERTALPSVSIGCSEKDRQSRIKKSLPFQPLDNLQNLHGV